MTLASGGMIRLNVERYIILGLPRSIKLTSSASKPRLRVGRDRRSLEDFKNNVPFWASAEVIRHRPTTSIAATVFLIASDALAPCSTTGLIGQRYSQFVQRLIRVLTRANSPTVNLSEQSEQLVQNRVRNFQSPGRLPKHPGC